MQLERTWEEILAYGSQLAGRRVRLTVLPCAARADPRTSDESRGFPFWETAKPEEVLARLGAKAVTDVIAFLKSLPIEKGADDLWEAIAEA
jgi:hypothetical protein